MAMPRALARWHRQHGRHKTRRRRRRTTAIVRYSRPTIVRYSGGGKIARRRHHRRRRHHGGGLGLSRGGIGGMLTKAAAGALWGYATDVKKLDILDKVPKVGGIPKELLIGAVLELTGLTRRGLGPIRAHWIDQIATAGIYIGGNQIGKANFKLSGDDD